MSRKMMTKHLNNNKLFNGALSVISRVSC